MGIPAAQRAELTALAGIASLRQGEIDNCIDCLGPSSCIFPIAPEAVHTQQAGSREAVKRFTDYLDEWPGDLRVRWLLNIAHMTLGEYPDKGPAAVPDPARPLSLEGRRGPVRNVASLVGLTDAGAEPGRRQHLRRLQRRRSPRPVHDFARRRHGAALFVNRGDGTFEDRVSRAGLDDQIYALNVTHADFDNDGDLDVLLLARRLGEARFGCRCCATRGTALRRRDDGQRAWRRRSRASRPPGAITTTTACVDLFVCGEYLRPPPQGSAWRCAAATRATAPGFTTIRATARSRTSPQSAGVTNERCGKGAAWGDYDGDGRLDLFVSNMGQACRLYHNEGDGTFRDVAPELGVTGRRRPASPAGSGTSTTTAGSTSTSTTTGPPGRDGRQRPGHQRHRRRAAPAFTAISAPSGFRDVTREVGLDRPMAPMGCNFGDIDNDGYLDIYLGTGWLSTSSLVPNLMFKNVDGERFEDVTSSSGTGHLQKGHGVSFADWDGDGDLDLFVADRRSDARAIGPTTSCSRIRATAATG